jgi:hypothetical protein
MALARSAHEAPQEVTEMSNITTTMTTVTQSAFAMPVYGRAFGTSGRVIPGIDVPARDRHLSVSLKGADKGTTVWRPPHC